MMELDAIENKPARVNLKDAVNILVEYGVCKEYATDLIIAIYLMGLREEE